MALMNKARGTFNTEQKRIVLDMSDKISMLRPSSAPLLVLTKKLDSNSCHNYKYEWIN